MKYMDIKARPEKGATQNCTAKDIECLGQLGGMAPAWMSVVIDESVRIARIKESFQGF